jgi:hypothetical protein
LIEIIPKTPNYQTHNIISSSIFIKIVSTISSSITSIPKAKMPPTTVIAYHKKRRDDTSVSTYQIQKSQPTSFCDDIANHFYINCLQPLCDLLPHAVDDNERLIAEEAYERSRSAVIDGNDMNMVSLWEKHLRRKRLERRMLNERRLQCQMQRQQAHSRLHGNRIVADEDDGSSCSGSFVINKSKPKRRTSQVKSKDATTTRADQVVVCSRKAVAKKSNIESGAADMKASSAIKTLILHTVRQNIAKNKVMRQPMVAMKKAWNSNSPKNLVNKKVFNVKPRMFRRKKKGGNDSIADDATLSSSNAPSESSCISHELVVTEVSAREFLVKTPTVETTIKEDDDTLSLAETKDASIQSVPSDNESVSQHSVKVPMKCIAVDCQHLNEPMPIVQCARRSFSPKVPQKSQSSRDEIHCRRTVYDESEVDKYVAKLIPSKVVSTKTFEPAFQNDHKCDEEETIVKDNESVAGSARSLDMKALMHSISKKYSLSKDNIKQADENAALLYSSDYKSNEDDRHSILTDEEQSISTFLSGPLPSVISLSKRAQRSVENGPSSVISGHGSSPTECDQHYQVTWDNDAPNIWSSDHRQEERSFTDPSPQHADNGAWDPVKASKLNRLRMVRTANTHFDDNTPSNLISKHGDSQMLAHKSVRGQPSRICCSRQSRKVTWAPDLPSISRDRALQHPNNIDEVPKSSKLNKMSMSCSDNSNAQCIIRNEPVAIPDGGKLNRLRMIRSVNLNSAPLKEERPDDEFDERHKRMRNAKCFVAEPIVQPGSNINRNLQERQMIDSRELLDSQNRLIIRRARYLHQKRLQQNSFQIELTSLVHDTVHECSDLRKLRQNKQVIQRDSNQLKKSRGGLLNDVRRVQSFQKATLL